MLIVKFVADGMSKARFIGSVFDPIAKLNILYPLGFAVAVWGITRRPLYAIVVFILTAAIIMVNGGSLW